MKKIKRNHCCEEGIGKWIREKTDRSGFIVEAVIPQRMILCAAVGFAAFVILFCCGQIIAADSALSSSESSVAVSEESHSAIRKTLSLDGVWQFATDPDKIGEKEDWFAARKKLPVLAREGYVPERNGEIRVPGIWDNQGYGTETPKLKHNYVGHAWYKKIYEIPADWQGKEIFLTLGGVSRYAKVWVNGRSVGKETIGPTASFSFNITGFLQYGATNDLTIRVDNHQRWEVDAILGASSLNDYMDIEWGGLWGHVTLEARPKERLDDLYLRTNLKDSQCCVQAAIVHRNTADSVMLEIWDRGGKKVAENKEKLTDLKDQTTVTVSAKIDNPKLWSPDSPYLYRVRLTLCSGSKKLDSLESRYGMREFRAGGTTILLNGKPIYLRGYGDDHIYPYEFSMPTDKAMYLARLKIIKAFGFNHVRHHSTIMPHEYYDACDEIGIIPTGEFPIGYPQQLPGNQKWLAYVPKGTPVEPALDVYRERFEQVVREYRNHPCLLVWIMGNELWNGMSICRDFKEIANRLDPERFFCDSDGDWARYFQNGKDRDTLDLYFVLFDEWVSPIIPGKFKPRGFKKPVISHESGNFITFSRPDQIDLFEKGNFKDNPSLAGKCGNINHEKKMAEVKENNPKSPVLKSNYKPFWMTDGVQKLAEYKLSDEVEEWARASEEIYYIHHKYNVESARLNPEISGYHWWLIQDYWTTSNGLVDLFFRPKTIAPERVRLFNNDLVLLQDSLDLTVRSGERQKYDLYISNYSEKSVTGILERENTISAAGYKKTSAYPVVPAAVGKLTKITSVDELIPDVKEPSEMKMEVRLKDQGGKLIQKNIWKTWIFPRDQKINSFGKKVYASAEVCEIFPELKMELMPEGEVLPSDAVYAVFAMEPRLVSALENGAGIVLLGETSIFPCISVQYQQTWWKGGDSDSANNVGTFVYPTKMMKSLETEKWCQPHWFYLLNGAMKYYLDKFPQRPEVHIRALPSLVRVQDTAILFDVQVGKGTLVVSGLNHQGAKGRAENNAVVAKMIERAASKEKPKTIWPKSIIQITESVPEGMTLGFRRLLPSKYEDVRWKNFRSDNARSFTCRQDSKENHLSWRTMPVDKNGKAPIFIFAGGMGFFGQPKTDGFTLEINGKSVLKFDLPDENAKTAQWKSLDGKTVLTFEIRRVEPQDQFGVFKLAISPSLLTGDKKGETITVRSLGAGSRRWFSINPIADLK